MPTYQYKCKLCGKEFDEFKHIEDRNNTKCKCGGDVQLLIKTNKHVGIHVWKPYWEENIAHQPVLVESKKHLKELCEKHDVIAHRLD